MSARGVRGYVELVRNLLSLHDRGNGHDLLGGKLGVMRVTKDSKSAQVLDTNLLEADLHLCVDYPIEVFFAFVGAPRTTLHRAE